MFSDNHIALGRELAADRVRAEHPRVVPSARLLRPPPVRGRAAYAAGRLARRLDSESARRAVA
jgi:hypothetical protein